MSIRFGHDRQSSPRTVRELAQRALNPLAKRFADRGREASTSLASAGDLHRFRIAAKKFRYTLELFQPLDSSLSGIVANINRLGAGLRRLGCPVIWVMHANTHRGGRSDWPLFFDHVVAADVCAPHLEPRAGRRSGRSSTPSPGHRGGEEPLQRAGAGLFDSRARAARRRASTRCSSPAPRRTCANPPRGSVIIASGRAGVRLLRRALGRRASWRWNPHPAVRRRRAPTMELLA